MPLVGPGRRYAPPLSSSEVASLEGETGTGITRQDRNMVMIYLVVANKEVKLLLSVLSFILSKSVFVSCYISTSIWSSGHAGSKRTLQCMVRMYHCLVYQRLERGIIFSGCLFVHSILVNAISQEHLLGGFHQIWSHLDSRMN